MKHYIILGLIWFFVIDVTAQRIKLIDNLQPAAKRAELLFNQEIYDEAAYYYNRAFEKDTSRADLALQAAACYNLISDHINAQLWYEIGLKKSESQNPEIWLGYAQSLAVNQQYDKAKKYLDKYNTYDGQDERVKRSIASLSDLAAYFSDSTSIQIKKLSLNTEYSEFSPSYYNDGIIYLSDKYSLATNNPLNWNNQKYIKYYYAREQEDGSMSESLEVLQELNGSYHQGPLVFYNKGQNVLFTRSGITTKDTRESNLELYQATYDSSDQKWSIIVPLPFNNENYSIGHPAISRDGSLLIFSSNMPGGFGGADLYISYREGNQWSTPKNLGSSINSEGDELFSYFEYDDQLVFSSNGHGGLGDLDLFRTDFRDSNNITVKNLGYPFNSSYADFGYVSDVSGTNGYFSSNRTSGSSNDDIYSFVINWCQLNVSVFEEESNKSVDEVRLEMTISNQVKDVKFSDAKGATTFLTFVGKDLEIKASKQGYKSSAVVVKSSQLSSGKLLPIKVIMKKQYVPTKKTPKDNLTELQDLYHKQKAMVLVEGSIFEYREIGQYRYLVNAEKKILLTKEVVDLNETLEERVKKAVQVKGLTMEGSFVIKNVYFDKNSVEISDLAKLELDKVVRIMTVDQNVAFEIASYTDSQGSASFNNELAFKRSQSIARYLMSKDISGSRLILENYGEQGLTNHCDDYKECDDLYHALNRRAELKLLMRKIYN